MSTALGQDNTPFFILGCVRSGTTMLRNLLRRHPRLESPEETHFFRWAEPYGCDNYVRKYSQKLLQQHRALDGVNEFDFYTGMKIAKNRRELSEVYARRYLDAIKNPHARWFDKTPQNVYGIFLINAYYPEAKFIHIYRNPLNVVASLLEGKVMPKHSLMASINYWLESMLLIDQFKKLHPDTLLEISYESVAERPMPQLIKILKFLEEDVSVFRDASHLTHPEKNKYRKILTREDISLIREIAEPFFSEYGYSVERL